MNIKEININLIKNYERNAKRHDDRQIKNVAESIKQFGFVQPVVVDRDNVIIIGHCRFAAAKKLKMSAVPCVCIEDLTDEQVQKLRLLDNKLNESEWDVDLLLEDIPMLDFSDFDIDWDLPDLNDDDEIIEDEAPEPPAEPRAMSGDLYELGGHRWVCGDSTDAGVVDRLMDGIQADMVFTDPPYNVNYDEKEKRLLKYHPNARVRENVNTGIENDNVGDYKAFCQNIANTIKAYTDGCCYVCGAQGADGRVLFSVLDKALHNSTTIIWNKPHFVLGDGKYQNKYEPIWFGWVKSGKSFTDDRTLTNVWNIEKPQKSDLHPTMKPIELIATAIKHNPKVKSVLDLFGGSGSTLLACQQTGRKCYMCELDPHYVDVIIQRYINFKGSDADVFLIQDERKIPYSQIER